MSLAFIGLPMHYLQLAERSMVDQKLRIVQERHH